LPACGAGNGYATPLGVKILLESRKHGADLFRLAAEVGDSIGDGLNDLDLAEGVSKFKSPGFGSF
jgi:hypothetical protein